MRHRNRTTRWFAVPALLLSLLALPAVAAEPAELMRERLAACAACHGDEGRTIGDDYFPSIAGKPAGYLYGQLLSFREGRRQHPIMAGLLAHLSDAYLGEIALYYAARPHAPQPPMPGVTPEQLALGERLTVLGDPERRIPALPGLPRRTTDRRGADDSRLARPASALSRCPDRGLEERRAPCPRTGLHGQDRPRLEHFSFKSLQNTRHSRAGGNPVLMRRATAETGCPPARA